MDNALSFQIEDISVASASCERNSIFDRKPGVFHQEAKLGYAKLADIKNTLYFQLELTITGRPKDSDSTEVSFTARCKTACAVIFDADAPERPGLPLTREVELALHTMAFIQCREMIASMGYPSPMMRAFLKAKNDQESKNPLPPPTKPAAKRPKKIAKSS